MGVKVLASLAAAVLLVFLVSGSEGHWGYGGRPDSFYRISGYVRRAAESKGIQAEPFQVGEYNEQVVENFPDGRGDQMTLEYEDDTIGFIFLYDSSEISFGNASVIMSALAAQIAEEYSDQEQRFFDPSILNPNTSLPFVHVQTAGNAAGAAFYYQRRQVTEEPCYWKDKDIFGTSVSPRFRLDTIFAGTILFEDLTVSRFHARRPYDIYRTQDEKIMLLNRNFMLFFNQCPLEDCEDTTPAPHDK